MFVVGSKNKPNICTILCQCLRINLIVAQINNNIIIIIFILYFFVYLVIIIKKMIFASLLLFPLLKCTSGKGVKVSSLNKYINSTNILKIKKEFNTIIQICKIKIFFFSNYCTYINIFI